MVINGKEKQKLTINSSFLENYFDKFLSTLSILKFILCEQEANANQKERAWCGKNKMFQ